MWSIALLLAALALLGHLVLCTALFSSVHATTWSHRTIQIFSVPAQLATFVVPIGIGLWAAFFARDVLSNGGWAWMLSPLGYFPICWIVAVMAVAFWAYRRLFECSHQSAVRNRTSIVRMPVNLTGDLLTGVLARLPGNQILELHVQEKTVEITRLPTALDGVSIVHVSDLHFTGQLKKEFFQRVCEAANDLNPDLVAITGDLIDNPGCIDWIPETLGKLRGHFGVYFVLGNHDLRVRDIPRLRRALTQCGLVDLSGRWVACDIRGEPVVLAGNELPWFAPAADLAQCPTEIDGKRPLRIVLSHSPDQIEWARAHDVDVMLAGHTHGGQIRLPLIGAVVSPSRRAVHKISGVFFESPTCLHISRGISGTRPLRTSCAPELTKLILTCTK
jgi:predicted MPP superfamily phosphohydrolase